MVLGVVEMGSGGEGIVGVGNGSYGELGVFVAVDLVFGLLVGFDFMDDGADEGEDDGHCLFWWWGFGSGVLVVGFGMGREEELLV